MMKMYIKYKLSVITAILQGSILFAAGANITSEMSTGIKLIFTNNDYRADFLFPGDTLKFDGFFEGLQAVQWIGMDGHLYEAPIGVPGGNAWRPITIKSNNTIHIGQETGSLFPGGDMGDRSGKQIG